MDKGFKRLARAVVYSGVVEADSDFCSGAWFAELCECIGERHLVGRFRGRIIETPFDKCAEFLGISRRILSEACERGGVGVHTLDGVRILSSYDMPLVFRGLAYIEQRSGARARLKPRKKRGALSGKDVLIERLLDCIRAERRSIHGTT